MFRLTTVNISDNWQEVVSYLGNIDRGVIGSAQLEKALEQYRSLDASALREAEPYLIVTGPGGKYIVRCLDRRLLLYRTDKADAPPFEGNAAEVIAELAFGAQNPKHSDENAASPPPVEAKAQRATNRLIAIGMLIVGLAINGYTLYSAFYVDDVNRTPPLTPISSQAEVLDYRTRFAGRYVTGDEPGDRGIAMDANGVLRLYQIGDRKAVVNTSSFDYVFGKRDRRLYIAIHGVGQIEAPDPEKLIFFGDTYRRLK